MAVKKGDKIKVEYEGRLEDGTIFDSSARHNTLLEFEVGAGKVIKGFEDAVIGMEKDEEKEIKIKPSEAYGERNQELIKKVPKEQLPPDAKKDMDLMIQLPNGMQVPVRIAEIDETSATLDLNHPLAGKTLIFKIKIVDIA